MYPTPQPPPDPNQPVPTPPPWPGPGMAPLYGAPPQPGTTGGYGQAPTAPGMYGPPPAAPSSPWAVQQPFVPPYGVPQTGGLQPPPPVSTPRGFDVRTLLAGLGLVVVVAVIFFTFPSAVAAGVRGAYPTVHAVISGVSDGATVPQGQSLTFSATRSTGKDLTYTWTFGDGSTASTPTVTKSFATAQQDVQVQLSVADPLQSSAGGHEDTTAITIHVLPPPPVASFVATIDEFGDLSLDATGSQGQIQSYDWSFGDGFTDETTSPFDNHSYLNNGTYTVMLTVHDSYGQSNTTTRTVTY